MWWGLLACFSLLPMHKLMAKETILPASANKVVFCWLNAELLSCRWRAVIPFGEGLVLANINVGILYLLLFHHLVFTAS